VTWEVSERPRASCYVSTPSHIASDANEKVNLTSHNHQQLEVLRGYVCIDV